jgi:hypothetical protein
METTPRRKTVGLHRAAPLIELIGQSCMLPRNLYIHSQYVGQAHSSCKQQHAAAANTACAAKNVETINSSATPQTLRQTVCTLQHNIDKQDAQTQTAFVAHCRRVAWHKTRPKLHN